MPVVPSVEFNDQLIRAVRFVLRHERGGMTQGNYRQQRESRLFGFLEDELLSTSDPREDWDSLPNALFNVYVFDQSPAASDGALVKSTQQFRDLEAIQTLRSGQVRVYNRTDMTFAADTWMEISNRFGRYQPYIANCNTTDLS